MNNQINLMWSAKNRNQPYWPTLKLILSSLIVFNFYLNLNDEHDFSLLIRIFDLTLIPMFVFIVAFITKNTTWKSWRNHLIPPLIIYFTFQTIDAIPLYFSGQLDLNTYLLFPQHGVWFFLATPIWQAIFLLFPSYIKNSKFCLFIILTLSLLIAYLTKDYSAKISTFFAIIHYFPFFIMAYFINEKNIFSLRKSSLFIILCIFILTISALYYQTKISDFITSIDNENIFISQFFIYIFSFLIGISLGLIIIYFALSTDKYAKTSNNALGIYLIHPIICFILLQSLKFFDIQITLPLVIILTLSTIAITLLLASNSIIHWFIDPVLNHKK
ncbi:acetyltransferase [Providencia heimbachae]|uniref:Acetyltransferase n=1 Tax=Providencia heimbachae ATCC 35613 TaxID=1354272 RepID=A0A1B7JJH0_9GAMM|nr:acetyltransferase [Providencia heimbachae]OAT48002.1 hypothetical protein M998_3428 [Providencia heimbachae ATCC 35613]SQH12651.1 Fucose 4-O-acetylase and related acetyltransferases [Providencia heimbachae]